MAELIQKAEGFWIPSEMILVIAGPTDGTYSDYIRKLASKFGVSASIYWTGMIVGDEKWGAFQSAEAFLLPSHQENFGIAVAEALSSSCPVLISSSINIANEILADGAGLVQADTVPGVIVNFKNWFSMTSAHKERMRVSTRICFESRYHISLTTASIVRNIKQSIIARSNS